MTEANPGSVEYRPTPRQAEPRTWAASSPEPPPGVDCLVDPLGFEMVRKGDLWHYADSEDGFPWCDLDDEFAVEWPLTEVVPAVSSPVSGENTTPAGKDTGEASSEALEPIRDFIVRSVGFDAGEGMTFQATELRDALLDAGWRPPPPEPTCERRGVWQSPDGIHLAVEAEDGEIEWLECDPVGGWLPLGMLDMVPDEWVRLVPLPDSETEWGCRWPNTNVVQSFGASRKDAEDYRFPGAQLVRREVGPWIGVTS